MNKITLSDIQGGYNLSAITANFTKIQDELNNKVLYRDNPDGTTNTVKSDIDFNGKRIYNLPAPTLPHEPARLIDIQDLTSGGAPITIEWGSVLNKPSTFPPDTHSHVIGDIAGLSASLATIATKQDTLVSGTNIKTINGQSILGSGDLTVVGGGGGGGDVFGPASATNDAVVLFSGTSGKIIKDSVKIAPTGGFVGTTDIQTLTNKTLTTPTINGGSATALASFAVRNAGTGAFDMSIGHNGTLTAERALTFNLNDAARTVSLTGNLSTAGGFGVTFTTTADSNITLPATGTLVTRTATETLTNKTLTAPTITDGTVDTFPIGYRNIPQNSQSTNYTCILSDAGKHIFHPSADTTARTYTIPANASVAYPIGTAITFVNQNAAGVITIAITTDTMRLAGAGTTGNRTLAANGVATAIKITSTEWIISGTGLT